MKPLLRRRNMKTKFAAFHGMVSSEVLDSRTESRFSEWNETIREKRSHGIDARNLQKCFQWKDNGEREC
jgi:hypothetical protein